MSTLTHNALAKNTYQGFDSHPHFTTDKTLSNSQKSSVNDDERYSTFQDALATCFVCNMHPYQAVSEFKDEFGSEPPPQYFRQWRRCWDELGITPEKVTAWLKEVDATGWIQRLGGVR